MKQETRDILEKLAKEMGHLHANPVLRSMYPSKSRGEMAGEFAQLFYLGFIAGYESGKKEISPDETAKEK